MPITLFCLIKGEKAFSVKISRDEPISELKKAIKAEKQNDFAGIEKVPISGDHDDQLRNLSLEDSDELLAINEIGPRNHPRSVFTS